MPVQMKPISNYKTQLCKVGQWFSSVLRTRLLQEQGRLHVRPRGVGPEIDACSASRLVQPSHNSRRTGPATRSAAHHGRVYVHGADAHDASPSSCQPRKSQYSLADHLAEHVPGVSGQRCGH
jgi:hypothetical protein